MKNVNLLCMFSGALLLAAAQVGCGDDTGTGGTGGSAGGSGGSGAQGGSGASGAQGGGGATSTGGSGGQASTGGAGGAGGGGQGSNVNVSFTNWPHVGMKLEAAIVSNGNVVQKQTVNDATATTMVTFTGIPDGTHRIHYYADVNDDTNCDAPPADHVWDKEIVVAGASTKTIPHDTDFVNTCATF